MKILEKILEGITDIKIEMSSSSEYKKLIRDKDIEISDLREKLNYEMRRNIDKDLLVSTAISLRGEGEGTELFVYKSYRSKPIIYKDGKRLDTDKMTYFDVDWDRTRKPEVNIRNE